MNYTKTHRLCLITVTSQELQGVSMQLLLDCLLKSSFKLTTKKIDGLVQERCNSSALAMELRLFCTNPSKWSKLYITVPLCGEFSCDWWFPCTKDSNGEVFLCHDIIIHLPQWRSLQLAPGHQPPPATGLTSCCSAQRHSSQINSTPAETR